MSKRAIIYARVSTDLQRDNYSIPSQVAEALSYVNRNGYLLVGDCWVDTETGQDTTPGNGATPAYVDDFSSRELSRPGLDAAIQYLETFGFDVVVIHSLDRLARDPYIRQTLEKEIEARGARVEFVLGNYEESAEGEVRKDLDATFGKWENAKRVERCNRGKKRKAESGIFVTGTPPYGYCIDENSPSRLGIDESQSQVVRWMFDLYVDKGLSIRNIITELEANNIPSPRNNDLWAPTQVRRILSNRAYIGQLYYNKSMLLTNKNRENRLRPDWILIPVAPIVEQWIFDLAQERFTENRERARRQPRRFYLLTGMVICDDCKRPYITQTYPSGKQRRVRDSQIYRHRKDRGHCANISIHSAHIEPLVWGEIASILRDPEKLRKGYQEALEMRQAAFIRHKNHLEVLGQRKAKLEIQRANLNAAYTDPDISLSKVEYIEQKARIDSEINGILKDIENRQKTIDIIPLPGELESLETFSAQVRQKFEGDIGPEDMRRILESLHVKIYVNLAGDVRVEGWFGSPKKTSLLNQPSQSPAGHRWYRPRHPQ